MRERFQRWIDQRGRMPGVLACGVRLADRTALSRSNSSLFPVERLDQTWEQLAETASGFAHMLAAGRRWRWTFENAQLYWIVRPDGACLGLFMASDENLSSPVVVERLVEDFLQLEAEP